MKNLAQVQIVEYLSGTICDICTQVVEGEAVTIFNWKGCCDEPYKDDTLVICHQCASNIRNACWKIEANQAQRAREVQENGENDNHQSPGRAKASGQSDQEEDR